MSTDLAPAAAPATDVSWETLEAVIGAGDLSALSARQKVEYYLSVCESLGLNWRTMPFRFIQFEKGGMQLYAQKGASDQLRKANRVTIAGLESRFDGKLYVVTCRVRDAAGREDVDIGVVDTNGLGGTNLANALKKAVTQAKRRATLSICGLGMLDESEVEDVPNARVVEVELTAAESPAPAIAAQLSGKPEPPAPSAPPMPAPMSRERADFERRYAESQIAKAAEPAPVATTGGDDLPEPVGDPPVAPGDTRPSREQIARFRAARDACYAAGSWDDAKLGNWIRGVYRKGRLGELTAGQLAELTAILEEEMAAIAALPHRAAAAPTVAPAAPAATA